MYIYINAFILPISLYNVLSFSSMGGFLAYVSIVPFFFFSFSLFACFFFLQPYSQSSIDFFFMFVSAVIKWVLIYSPSELFPLFPSHFSQFIYHCQVKRTEHFFDINELKFLCTIILYFTLRNSIIFFYILFFFFIIFEADI